jgi:hypothetical protein
MIHTVHKNILIGIATLVSVLGFAFIPLPLEAAVPDLAVTFEQTPLFSELEVKPGDMVTRTVLVTNNGSENHTVITTTQNVDNTDAFGDALDLDIDFGVVNKFSNTFTNFFAESELVLGILLPGQSVILSYSVGVNPSAGNVYQGTEMTFDLLVGFQEGEVVPDTTPPTPTPSPAPSAGGGVISTAPAFFISNVRILSQDALLGTATIAWDTNLLASSQIVYGPESGAPYSLNAGETFFGYPQGLAEVFSNTIAHQMTLTGLTAGETYRFRTASRPSSAGSQSTSFEFSFTLGQEETGPIAPPITSTEILQDGTSVDGGGVGGIGGGGTGTGGGTDTGGAGGTGGGAEGITPDESTGIGAAAAAFLGIPAEFFEFLGSVTCWLWIILILALLALLWLGIDYFVDDWSEQALKARGRSATFLIGLLVGIGTAWFIGELCLIIPLAIGALIALIFLIFTFTARG